ncbi:MAG: hemin uptake protein HemP [Planctomycetota bacterium]
MFGFLFLNSFFGGGGGGVVSGEDDRGEAEGVAAGGDGERPGRIREVRFEQISGGLHEVIVEYAGNRYRLLATKNGRLVLNK